MTSDYLKDKKTEFSELARKYIEAACPNVKNGVYLYDRFKTLDDIRRNKESWYEFWYSDSNFPREVIYSRELVEIFDNGWVKLEPLPENGTKIKIDDYVLNQARSGRESEQHSRLKALAAMWLISQGEKQVYFEHYITGSRADVYGKDLDCWVECGNTSADKIIYSLFDAGCKSFVVFPFVFHDFIEGYRFTLTIDDKTRKEWMMEQIQKKSPTKGIL